MAFNEGFNFRSTLAFVTDPADTQFADSTVTYPQTAGGVTFGWIDVATIQERDRNSGIDARLAGHQRVDIEAAAQFRVDLPAAGNYEIRLAYGDASYASGPIWSRILDNTTVLHTVAGTSTSGAAKFLDATDVERTSAADWVTNNAAATYAFATTTFFLEIGRPSSPQGSSPICHLQIVQLPDATYTAFQGFQSDAFQGPAGYLQNLARTAFQQNAFQSDAFQIFGGTLPAGAGDMSAAGTLSITGAADLDAYGNVVAAGTVSITGAADLDAQGNLAAAGSLSITGAADLDAQGNLTAAGTLSITGAADLDALGNLAAAGTVSITGAADLDAAGNLVAAGTLSITGDADLDAYGDMAAAGTLVINGSALFDGAVVVEDVPGGPGPRAEARRRVRVDEELDALLLERILEEDNEIIKVIEAFLEQGTVYRLAA